MTVILLLGGILLLAIGGELLVRGSVGVARYLGVSPLLAGLTIVGFGTSAPELATSLQAALAGSPGIAVGNVVGSNIANFLLIIGISAMIMPLAITPKAFRRDGLALMIATLGCAGIVMFGFIERWMGIVLLVALAGYIVWAFLSERETHDSEAVRHEQEAGDIASPVTGIWTLIAISVGGIAAAVIGADFLVTAAIDLARGWGISEAVIGVTVVAFGTSLPELVACVVAAMRNHGDVALGNAVGSNIYNICAILGITAIVHPLEVPPEIMRLDIWVMVGVAVLMVIFLRTGWTFKRWEGAVFAALYAAYIAVQVSIA
ncbi:calcium/sodium antiporter [Altererythrobacter aquiaggeris]|uniref:calcium/sodium antiporter n=1 Tax=Aestuarierythrobacter aquiaggeris TaxID=1898396 RepID=UPI0030160E3D